MHIDPLIHFVAIGFVSVVLARATVEKASDWSIYVANLRDYRLLPDGLAPFAAAALLAAELLAIICLLAPTTSASAAGAVIAATLFAFYGAAMAVALFAGRTEIECGCGGEGQLVTWGLVARNGVLVAIAALVSLPVFERRMAWSDMLIGLGAIFVTYLLLVIAETAVGASAAIRRLESHAHH